MPVSEKVVGINKSLDFESIAKKNNPLATHTQHGFVWELNNSSVIRYTPSVP